MRLFIEIDGVVLDLQPAWWAAYRAAVASVGLAPADERTFWRLVRTGAADERLLERARPHQIKHMRSELDRRLAFPEAWAALPRHEHAGAALERLTRRFDVHAISASPNAGAVLAALQHTPAAAHFQGIDQIAPDPALAASVVRSLVEDHRPAAVLGASESIARAASDAKAINIGIASGACIGKRLAKWGTAAVYSDLSAFADAVDRGDSDLVRAGLLLA